MNKVKVSKGVLARAKKLLLDGRIEEAIGALQQPLKGTQLEDEWMAVHIRYQRLEEEEIKGLLTQEESRVARNRIQAAFLGLLEETGEVAVVAVPKKRKLPVLLSIAAALAALALGAWYFARVQEPAPAQAAPQAKQRDSAPPPGKAAAPAELAAPQGAYTAHKIRKRVGDAQLPFEISELRIYPQAVEMDIQLQNRSSSVLTLGAAQLLLTDNQETRESLDLGQKRLMPGEALTASLVFPSWRVKEPEAFRFRLSFKPSEGRARSLRTVFGIYD